MSVTFVTCIIVSSPSCIHNQCKLNSVSRSHSQTKLFLACFLHGSERSSSQHSKPGTEATLSEDTPKKKDDLAILTVHDVADYLRMSEAKVYRLVKGKQIPVVRIGKTWRFRKDLLD